MLHQHQVTILVVFQIPDEILLLDKIYLVL